MYEALFQPITIRETVVANRIVMPPMVCFGWRDKDGMVTGRSVNHYEARARGGTGLIIVEATAVMPEGRLASEQLGLWNDRQAAALAEIPARCHTYGAKVLIQIHHAGHKIAPGMAPSAKGPSALPDNPETAALTISEIYQIRDAFVLAAIRAEQAGFDGVELHGAHGYLLNQFASPAINLRTDDFGGSLENRMRLTVNIINIIRKKCSSSFIIACRLGANSPFLADGIEIASYLEKQGIDYLHVSHGGNMDNPPPIPEGFDYNWIVWSASEIRKHISIPVIAVNSIKTPARAEFLIKNKHADLVAIGRDILTDPDWALHARSGLEVIQCLQCKPRCHWYTNSDDCPGKRQ
ncbi:MAG: NADH:flavin oxidoreductase [Bacteroidia bacterium]|nr:NADH:flavin oxidoreductase [Bacteroidia bacterium]